MKNGLELAVDTEHILVGLIGCAGDSGRFLEAI
jgi:hypothetical protein